MQKHRNGMKRQVIVARREIGRGRDLGNVELSLLRNRQCRVAESMSVRIVRSTPSTSTFPLSKGR